MNKTLHQVWIQGEANLPVAYQENRALWQAALPDWEFILWDNEQACAQWRDYAMVEERCFHHATRTDLILARAQRDFGGLATGTDVIPKNIPNLLHWLEGNETMVLANIVDSSASNGLSYFAKENHPFIQAVCEHQLRDLALLGDPNVWMSTGPGCWFEVLKQKMWNLSLATDARAYSQLCHGVAQQNPLAWVDPGYAGSWHA